MAKLKPMKFKTFTWPHNPETYNLTFDKNYVIHEYPNINAAEIEFLSLKPRVVRGKGAFFGRSAYSTFKKLEKVYKNKTPGNLIHPNWPTFRATFTHLSLTQVPLPNYVEYEFEFIEDVKINSIQKVGKVKPKPKPKTTVKSTTRTYTVKKGDTLWAIAKKYYGNGAQYKKIANANKKLIKNPNLIHIGWKLTIPK